MIVGVGMRVIRAITIKRLHDLGQQAEVLCDLCTIILAYMQVDGHAMQCNVTDARVPRHYDLSLPLKVKTVVKVFPIYFHRFIKQRSTYILRGPAKRLYSI